MLRSTQRYTNRKAVDVRRCAMTQYGWMQNFSNNDILACIGIIISAGADRVNFTAIEELWNPVDSRPFYHAVMSCQRFKFFLRTVRFDNFCNRDLRLQENQLAAINEFWDELVENLKKYYIPGDVITVDETVCWL